MKKLFLAFAKLTAFLIFALVVLVIVSGNKPCEVVSKTHFREYFIYHNEDGKKEIARIEKVKGDDKGSEPGKPGFKLAPNEVVDRVQDRFEVVVFAKDGSKDFWTHRSNERHTFDALEIGMSVRVTPMDSIPYEASSLEAIKED